MSIGSKQLQLIDRTKLFLKKLDSINMDSSLSCFCYFASWTETPGYAKLQYWLKGWFFIFRYCNIILKNILAIASHANYIEIKNKSYSGYYETLVLSWSFKKDFQDDGSFNDRYFNENSKDLNKSYWILISADDYAPPNLNNNITIIKNQRGIFKYNFFYFIKIFICAVLECKFSIKKIYHYFSYSSYLAKIVSRAVNEQLKKNDYKVVLSPYEAQPFQNYIFSESKKFNKNIVTIGYVHSLLNPFPSDLIYRRGAPDKLLAHGESQIEILEKKLNWPKNKLFLIESLRYRVNNAKSLSNKIFLPFSITKGVIFIKEFEKVLIKAPINSFPIFKIENHPAMLNSKKHISFKNKLEKIIKKYENRFSINSSNNNISIFFGVTATIIEALEKKVEAIHVCSDPILESHSELIWPNLKVNQLGDFSFNYKLDSIGKYINFGRKEKILNDILKNLY